MSEQRKYSVDEIDRMRDALMNKWWTAESRLGWKDAAEAAERELRTYMLNGTEPEELEAVSR